MCCMCWHSETRLHVITDVTTLLASPSGCHVSWKVSSVMEQLIVLEQLLCRVMRLHALRTDEALNVDTTM